MVPVDVKPAFFVVSSSMLVVGVWFNEQVVEDGGSDAEGRDPLLPMRRKLNREVALGLPSW